MVQPDMRRRNSITEESAKPAEFFLFWQNSFGSVPEEQVEIYDSVSRAVFSDPEVLSYKRR